MKWMQTLYLLVENESWKFFFFRIVGNFVILGDFALVFPLSSWIVPIDWFMGIPPVEFHWSRHCSWIPIPGSGILLVQFIWFSHWHGFPILAEKMTTRIMVPKKNNPSQNSHGRSIEAFRFQTPTIKVTSTMHKSTDTVKMTMLGTSKSPFRQFYALSMYKHFQYTCHFSAQLKMPLFLTASMKGMQTLYFHWKQRIEEFIIVRNCKKK